MGNKLSVDNNGPNPFLYFLNIYIKSLVINKLFIYLYKLIDMTKIEKEAKLYENVSNGKLKRVIIGYKLLSFTNSKTVNFIISLLFILVPYFILFKTTILSSFLVLLFHYLIFWEYLYKTKNIKLVDDNEKREIDGVIQILETYLNKRKNPS